MLATMPRQDRAGGFAPAADRLQNTVKYLLKSTNERFTGFWTNWKKLGKTNNGNSPYHKHPKAAIHFGNPV